MIKRTTVIPLRLNKKELTHLNNLANKSGLSREKVLRGFINNTDIKQKPCTHHAELIRKISGLCNNANQLAFKANSTGIATQESIDEMLRITKEIWTEIKENW